MKAVIAAFARYPKSHQAHCAADSSALDLSEQAQLIKLLRKLRAEKVPSDLFISHDLKVVCALCHKMMVMQRTPIVEQGLFDDVLSHLQTEYTSRLVRAAFEIAA